MSLTLPTGQGVRPVNALIRAVHEHSFEWALSTRLGDGALDAVHKVRRRRDLHRFHRRLAEHHPGHEDQVEAVCGRDGGSYAVTSNTSVRWSSPRKPVPRMRLTTF